IFIHFYDLGFTMKSPAGYFPEKLLIILMNDEALSCGSSCRQISFHIIGKMRLSKMHVADHDPDQVFREIAGRLRDHRCRKTVAFREAKLVIYAMINRQHFDFVLPRKTKNRTVVLPVKTETFFIIDPLQEFRLIDLAFEITVQGRLPAAI